MLPCSLVRACCRFCPAVRDLPCNPCCQCKPVDLFVMLPMMPGSPCPPWEVALVSFCWVCAAGLSEPLPYYSLFLANYKPKESSCLEIFTCQKLLISKFPKRCDTVLVTLLQMYSMKRLLYCGVKLPYSWRKCLL